MRWQLVQHWQLGSWGCPSPAPPPAPHARPPQRTLWTKEEEAALVRQIKRWGRGSWQAILDEMTQAGELRTERNPVRWAGRAPVQHARLMWAWLLGDG